MKKPKTSPQQRLEAVLALASALFPQTPASELPALRARIVTQIDILIGLSPSRMPAISMLLDDLIGEAKGVPAPHRLTPERKEKLLLNLIADAQALLPKPH